MFFFSFNGLGIEDVLQQKAIEAAVTHGAPPYQSEDGAGSFAVAAIGFAISQVLTTLHDKPYFVEYYENVELRDKS